MNKIVIAVDSFKGCLSAREVTQAVEEGIQKVFPGCQIVSIPMADGGEGILDILAAYTQGTYYPVPAHDPLMNKMDTAYAVSGDCKTVFIEMATVSGLPLVPPAKRNPMVTTSYGTGELIKDALDKGFRDFVIGIGGSATNDAGLGMLQALGFRFFDKQDKQLGTGGEILPSVAKIDTTGVHPALKEACFRIACDVRNPFYGPEGAVHIYARQKGADEAMIDYLEQGMQSLAKVIRTLTGKDISLVPGAGAAGGMGGAFLAFFNAALKPGIELILEMTGFSRQIAGADLIITGEGRADAQTLMGKVPSGILQAAQKQDIPVVLIAGSVSGSDKLIKAGFAGVFPVTPPGMSLEKAMEPAVAFENIGNAVSQIIRDR